MGLLGDVFGAFAANEQENDEYARYQDYLGLGGYYRNLLKNTFKPGGVEGYLSGEEVAAPVDAGTSALMRALSAKGGNPFGSPGALAEATKYASGQFADRLAGYRRDLSSFGNTGLSAAFNQSGRQLDAQKDVYNAQGNLLSNSEDALMKIFSMGAGGGAPPGMGTGATAANVDFLPW